MDKTFTTDGCSVVPEANVAVCCVDHDWAYWQGGTSEQRREADRVFRQCQIDHGMWKLRAKVRYWGVRVFAVPWLPLWFRWGYGWRYPRSAAPDADNSPVTAESQREHYEEERRKAAAG